MLLFAYFSPLPTPHKQFDRQLSGSETLESARQKSPSPPLPRWENPESDRDEGFLFISTSQSHAFPSTRPHSIHTPPPLLPAKIDRRKISIFGPILKIMTSIYSSRGKPDGSVRFVSVVCRVLRLFIIIFRPCHPLLGGVWQKGKGSQQQQHQQKKQSESDTLNDSPRYRHDDQFGGTRA